MPVKIEVRLPGVGPNYAIYSIEVPPEAFSPTSEHENRDFVQEQVAKLLALVTSEVHYSTYGAMDERNLEVQTPLCSHEDCIGLACIQALLHVDLSVKITLLDVDGGTENSYYIARNAPLRTALKAYAEQAELPVSVFSMRHEGVGIKGMETADSLNITDGATFQVVRWAPEPKSLLSTPTKLTFCKGMMEDPFFGDEATSEVRTDEDEEPPKWPAEWRKGRR